MCRSQLCVIFSKLALIEQKWQRRGEFFQIALWHLLSLWTSLFTDIYSKDLYESKRRNVLLSPQPVLCVIPCDNGFAVTLCHPSYINKTVTSQWPGLSVYTDALPASSKTVRMFCFVIPVSALYNSDLLTTFKLHICPCSVCHLLLWNTRDTSYPQGKDNLNLSFQVALPVNLKQIPNESSLLL